HRSAAMDRVTIPDDEMIADDADDGFADAGHLDANTRFSDTLCAGFAKEKNVNAASAHQLGLKRQGNC
ncbi:MAG: hypothetical protein H7245_13615, partial [Candidatus Saccharibacteria bacterium]|nr:hypothetical protein [Pseudorhodobacter sp.]